MSGWLEENEIPLGTPEFQYFEEPVLISSVSSNQKEISSDFIGWSKCTLMIRAYIPPRGQGLRGGPTYRYLLAYRTHLAENKDFNVFALRYFPPEQNQWGVWISNNKAESKDITISDELASGWHHFHITWDHSKPELIFLIDEGKGGSSRSESYLSSWPEPKGNRAFVGSWISYPSPPYSDSYCETYLHRMAIYNKFLDLQTLLARKEPQRSPSWLQTNDSSRSRSYYTRVDVLLVTATKVEALAILNLVEKKFNRKYKVEYIDSQTFYDLGEIGGARTCMIRSEMGEGGPSGSTVTVLESIAKLSPSAVMMVGIAFGVDSKRQAIGDILVSRQLMPYELQRISTGESGELVIVPRSDRPSAPPQILDRFRDAELHWTGQKVEFGLVLSGQKLVDNTDFREQLKELESEAVGGEMEGGGLYSAAHRRKVDWIVVKAICDWADGKKHENKSQRQELAAHNAASFVIYVIERGGFAGKRSATVQPSSVQRRLASETLVAVSKEQELIREIDSLKQGTIGDCRSLIEELGRYYQGVIPSTVNEDLIVKTQEMLTNLRRNFDESSYRPALKSAIQSVLGTASALGYEISYRSSRSEEFFERVPQLGDKLLALDKVIDIATIR